MAQHPTAGNFKQHNANTFAVIITKTVAWIRMDKEALNKISDADLLSEVKRNRKYKTYDSVIFGFLVGVAIYSTVNNGFGLMTFLPLVYLPIAGKNRKRYDTMKNELLNRGLPDNQ